MEEYWYWICGIKGIYRNQISRLTDYFGDPRHLFFAREKEINGLVFLNETEKKVLIQAKNNTDIDKEYHNRRKKHWTSGVSGAFKKNSGSAFRTFFKRKTATGRNVLGGDYRSKALQRIWQTDGGGNREKTGSPGHSDH